MLMIQIDGGGKRTGGGNFPEKDSQKLEKQKNASIHVPNSSRDYADISQFSIHRLAELRRLYLPQSFPDDVEA
jgi:hypothetical protein